MCYLIFITHTYVKISILLTDYRLLTVHRDTGNYFVVLNNNCILMKIRESRYNTKHLVLQ